MLNLVPAPMDIAQREALDQLSCSIKNHAHLLHSLTPHNRRRRAVAQKRAEDKRREQQREQQAFQAMAEEEAEKKRQHDAKLRAQQGLERQRREADEAERMQLDEKRQRLAAMPQEVHTRALVASLLTFFMIFLIGSCKQNETIFFCQSISAARAARNRGGVWRLGPWRCGRFRQQRCAACV